MLLFFELIQIALGNRKKLSRAPLKDEWAVLFSMAQNQTVAGLIFSVLNKLSEDGIKPPLLMLYEWISISEQIKQRNTLLNKRCINLIQLFEENGFQSCILKGQGNALMYPEPLLRTPGDIDIWVFQTTGNRSGRENNKRKDIINFCRARAQGCNLRYHHIEFPIWNEVDVEVHFMPSYSLNPRFARRTQLFFDNFKRETINGGMITPNGAKFYVPHKDINLFFQLSHMARHFFNGGIGLRQVIDYYYLLLYCHVEDNDIIDIRKNLRYLGLEKFAGAVMWVLRDILGMDEKYLIAPADKKRGEMLINEITRGGNFGKYDKRLPARLKRKSSTLSAVTRCLRLLRFYPEEAFWVPIMGVYYYLKYRKG